MNKEIQQIEVSSSSGFLKFPISIFILSTALTLSCTRPSDKHAPDNQETKVSSDLAYLLKPTNATVIASIRTIVPIQKSMPIQLKASGIITYDTRRFSSIPIRFGGRIEALSVRYNFQPVRKGQKILEIYSPELLTAQRDFLYLLRADKDNLPLINAAKEKLILLGLSKAQIETLISTGKENYSFAVYSPVDGYVVEEKKMPVSLPVVSKPAGSAMNDAMGEGNSNATQNASPLPGSDLQTREGMYVSSGQAVFKVINIDYVWAEFDLYQQDAAFIKTNEPVTVALDNVKDSIEAKVSFIQPFFNDGGNFSRVRVYIRNSDHNIMIGQLATATFKSESPESTWIPLSARLQLGNQEIVFEKRRGVYRPQVIHTSRQSGNWIEVTKGIQSGDSLAYDAQFMVDSESFIKIKN